MFGCTVKLDGKTVIDRGTVVDENMIVESQYEQQIVA